MFFRRILGGIGGDGMKYIGRLLALAAAAVLLVGVQAQQGAEKFVALTFDDGPTPGVTERLLEGLAERYVSATFFLCGYRMENAPQLVEQIVENGHEVGIHGYSHCYLHDLPQSQVLEELTATAERIEALTGQRPTLLRPPGGLLSDALRQTAANQNLPIILWNVDTMDWCCSDPQTVAQRIVETVEDGDIVLLHDLHDSSVQGVLLAIDQLERQGYQFCTVSELAMLHGVPLEPGRAYGCF